MSEVFYTEKNLKNMPLMKVVTEGPFSITKWLEFCKSSSNIPDDFKSKILSQIDILIFLN